MNVTMMGLRWLAQKVVPLSVAACCVVSYTVYTSTAQREAAVPAMEPPALAVFSDGPFRAELHKLDSHDFTSAVHARFFSSQMGSPYSDSTSPVQESCAERASEVHGHTERGQGVSLFCVTWQRAIELWCSADANGSSFRRVTVSALEGIQLKAFFWETPPFSVETARYTPFEFVALNAPGLDNTEEDGSAFSEHLPNSVGQFRVFKNLGGDSLLIAPPDLANRTAPPNTMSHIAAFVRGAPPSMKLELFSAIGHTLSQELKDGSKGGRGVTPVWVNTEGSGVPFLHVRLDPRPKYIHYRPYQTWPPNTQAAS